MSLLTRPRSKPAVETSPVSRVSDQAPSEPLQRNPGAPQHPLWLSTILHLLPGFLLAVFVVLATPVLASWGLDPLFALLFGIGLVIVPAELGYLTLYARRATGSWSPLKAVTYGAELPMRRVLRLAVPPALLMVVLTAVSMAVIDGPLARSIFGWLPTAITDMAVVSDNDAALSGPAIAALLITFIALNGILGPIAEELYFRGHLLPRIDRLGWVAPLVGTALFTLYHFHTPWRYPAIFLGFLPLAWLAWRTRSFRVSLAAHILVNNLFIFLMVLAFLGDAS